MRPSSSTADPFAFLTGRGPVAAAVAASAWVQAMLDVEAALLAATGGPHDGDVGAAAAAVAGALASGAVDTGRLVAAAEGGGNLLIPLLAELRAIPAVAAVGDALHRGATSQDVVDAAALVVVARAAPLVRADLATTGDRLAALSNANGAASMIGRTLLQFAEPTTFGAVVGRWTASLDGALGALDGIAPHLTVRLGGPTGDGTSFTDASATAARVAADLGLAAAPHPFTADRTPFAAIAGAFGVVAAAVGKVALDVVLLAQGDVGEVAERGPGAGGSSSMPHKHNPVAAVAARAAAMQAPGLVATMLHATASGELERAAGAWHAEWPALRALLLVTGSAASWLASSTERLTVDTDRMAANLHRAIARRDEWRPR